MFLPELKAAVFFDQPMGAVPGRPSMPVLQAFGFGHSRARAIRFLLQLATVLPDRSTMAIPEPRPIPDYEIAM